jgi:peptidoglycan hydrolase-like protein with peptidoglycan-binding domain
MGDNMALTVIQIKAIQKVVGVLQDGNFGPVTKAAVKVWQGKHGLLKDGIVGPVTWKHMFPTVVTPTPAADELGYFINRVWNPLQNISWTGLKAKGINTVYIRCAEENLEAISAYLPAIKAAGLKPYAWTWEGFTMTKQAVAKGWNICADIEGYDLSSHVAEIKAIQAATKAGGKTFILCTKAQGWDGDQIYSTLAPICDYIMPMLYIGDYGKTVVQLAAWMKEYNTKFPNKIYPVLETYKSDANPVSKDLSVLKSEIAACEPYCKGIGLFRYGITPL